MKWYHKALYRAVMSVIPAPVKRMMMGIGRATVPKDSNPWSWFSWLPKKYQNAHNIDLTKLQNHTAEELLELLISVHPDVSHALYTYLRMGDTTLTFTAKKKTGSDDKSGQRVLDELKEMLNTPLPSPGYQHGRSLDKIDTVQRLMVMVRGACAGEVVLNERCNDVVDIVPVDPALIWFRREPDSNRLTPWQYVKNPKPRPGEEWFGQYKKIDTPTFIYEEFDPMVDDPYGRTPILPVLQVVFFHLQVLQDLKAVVHNQGYPRLDISMMEEIMLKNVPPQYKNNPKEQQKWLAERMEEMLKHFNSLNPDDAMIHWDSVKVEYLKGGNNGPMIDIKKLIDIIDTQMATALKTLLTLLSRHQGSTETYSSIDTQIYIKMVESARSVVKRFWQRSFSLAARVRGTQTVVEADYDPIDLRTENEVERDRKSKINNYVTAEKNFYITPEEAAKEIRWTFGLDAKIPPELAERLKTKHDQVEEPPNNNPPPSGGLRKKLDITEGGDEEDSLIEEYIAFYLLMMGHIKQNLRQVTTIDKLEPSLRIAEWQRDQHARALWQLYRSSFTTSWNRRAIDLGGNRIRYPDTTESVNLFNEARKVADGTTNTYHEEMLTRLRKALDDTANLSDEQRLKSIKDAMDKWLDNFKSYKATQIANHEAIVGYHKGLFAHDSANAPDTLYNVEPSDSLHEGCLEIIAGAPYTLEEAQAQFLPLHPNCIHYYVPIGGE